MAILKSVGGSNAKVKIGIDYITKEEKTENTLINGYNCDENDPIKDMETTKKLFNKTDGRQYLHYVISFNPEDKLSLEKANEIGIEFMEKNKKWVNYEVLMATHKDKNHIHNHYIINSVSFIDGKKYKRSPKELEEFKNQLKELSKEHKLTIPEKTNESGTVKTNNQNKYQVIKKGKSYLKAIYDDLRASIQISNTKHQVIKEMENKGYKMDWRDNRKHITITNQDNKKVRVSNLEKTFSDKSLNKENLEQYLLEKEKRLNIDSKLVESKEKLRVINSKENEIKTALEKIKSKKESIKKELNEYDKSLKEHNKKAENIKITELFKGLKSKKGLDEWEKELEDKGYSKEKLKELENKINKLAAAKEKIENMKIGVKKEINFYESINKHQEKEEIIPKKEKELKFSLNDLVKQAETKKEVEEKSEIKDKIKNRNIDMER